MAEVLMDGRVEGTMEEGHVAAPVSASGGHGGATEGAWWGNGYSATAKGWGDDYTLADADVGSVRAELGARPRRHG